MSNAGANTSILVYAFTIGLLPVTCPETWEVVGAPLNHFLQVLRFYAARWVVSNVRPVQLLKLSSHIVR